MKLRRLAKWTGIILLIIASFKAYVYGHDHYIVQNIDNFGGLSSEAKQLDFSVTFPSRTEIEDFLRDTTILVSWPPIGNSVRYFDNDQRFFDWHGVEIIRGHWQLHPMIVRRIFNGRSRFDWAYSYCIELNDGSLTEDNCLLIYTTKQLLGSSRPTERAKGDFFGLSKQRDPPFEMPKTEISIEELRSLHR
jgi:hypothetical protein